MEKSKVRMIQSFLRCSSARKSFTVKCKFAIMEEVNSGVTDCKVSVKMHRNRCNLINELITSEAEYIRNLHLLFDVFLRPMKERAKKERGGEREEIEKKREEIESLIGVMSSDVLVIMGFQNKFLEELRQRISASGSAMEMGDLFLHYVVYMKTYLTYMNHYQRLIPLLSALKNTSIHLLIESLRNEACNGKGLKDFLIMPVQRIPRYALLLREIVRNTWKEHKDYAVLQQSEVMVLNMAEKIDVMLDEFKSLEKLMQLHHHIVFKKGEIVLLVPHRKLIADIEEIKVQFTSEKQPTPRRMIIFNDIILFTSVLPSKKKTFIVEKYLYTDTLSLRYPENEGKEYMMLRAKNKAQTKIYPEKVEALQVIIEQTIHRKEKRNNTIPPHSSKEGRTPSKIGKNIMRSLSREAKRKEDAAGDRQNNKNSENSSPSPLYHSFTNGEKAKEKMGIFSKRRSGGEERQPPRSRFSLTHSLTSNFSHLLEGKRSSNGVVRSTTSSDILQEGKQSGGLHRTVNILEINEKNENGGDGSSSPSPSSSWTAMKKTKSDQYGMPRPDDDDDDDDHLMFPLSDRPSLTPRMALLEELSSHFQQ